MATVKMKLSCTRERALFVFPQFDHRREIYGFRRVYQLVLTFVVILLLLWSLRGDPMDSEHSTSHRSLDFVDSGRTTYSLWRGCPLLSVVSQQSSMPDLPIDRAL